MLGIARGMDKLVSQSVVDSSRPEGLVKSLTISIFLLLPIFQFLYVLFSVSCAYEDNDQTPFFKKTW